MIIYFVNAMLYDISESYFCSKMSDQEASGDERDLELGEGEETIEEREELDYEVPLSALPPKVVLQEENQKEVSASPAFQVLDDVSSWIHWLVKC